MRFILNGRGVIMHPRTMWLIMMAWMAVIVGMGHYDNASQIGSAKWLVGVVAGLAFCGAYYDLFCGAYYALKSKLLNVILTISGIVLLLTGAFGKLELADSSNKIVLTAFVLGALLVMIWQGIRTEMTIRKKRNVHALSSNSKLQD